MSDEALPVKWPVYAGYRIEGRRLRPVPPVIKGNEKDSGMTFYAPGIREELPNEIAKLQRNDKAAVMAFAHQYGSLGFSELSKTKVDQSYGDPLNWLWLHAETLALCLSLKEMLDVHATESLHRRLRDMPQLRTHSTYLTPCVIFGSQGNAQEERFFQPDIPDRTAAIRSLAANILATIVNANIANIHPFLVWGTERQAFVQHFRYTALIEVAYWHVANVMHGGRVKRCLRPGCRGIFIQTDRRQRFCPTGTKHESPCAVFKRVDEFRRVEAYAQHAKISRKLARMELTRIGIDASQKFDFQQADLKRRRSHGTKR